MKKITRTYPNIAVASVDIPTDADAIARGRHVSVIWVCTTCHGEDLSGRLLTNDPIEGTIPTFGSIPAPNLTSGNGGVGQLYSDIDWVRAIRHDSPLLSGEGSGVRLLNIWIDVHKDRNT